VLIEERRRLAALISIPFPVRLALAVREAIFGRLGLLATPAGPLADCPKIDDVAHGLVPAWRDENHIFGG
jgi:hypothetical protein